MKRIAAIALAIGSLAATTAAHAEDTIDCNGSAWNPAFDDDYAGTGREETTMVRIYGWTRCTASNSSDWVVTDVKVALLRRVAAGGGWDEAEQAEPGAAGGGGTARANGGRHGDQQPDWYPCPYPGPSQYWKVSVFGRGENATALYMKPWWEGNDQVTDTFYEESAVIARRCLLLEDAWPG